MPKRESIQLSDEQKAALEKVAADTGTVNQRGTAAGVPSWRALVYAIASSAVRCIRRKPSRPNERTQP